MPKTRNRRRTRHRVSVGRSFDEENQREPLTVPLWVVTSFAAVFLLIPAWSLTVTFFSCLKVETVQHGFWQSEEFWFFALGSILMTIAFFGLPKPVRIYVFGHELTHAIWVWLMGGRVNQFKVTSEGGHIITDRTNIWIALSPYFYPVYSMILLVLYGIAAALTDVSPYHRLFFALLGVTWTFHACFTVWMIPKGQTDLTCYGVFFSLVLIYLMNLLVLGLMLIVASPRVSFPGFVHAFFVETANVCQLLWNLGSS